MPAPSTPTAPSSSACAHCGLPAPASEPGVPSFCCPGCETVYSLLHEVGLERYYDLRDRIESERVPGQTRATRAADDPAFAHLDDPRVQAGLSGGKQGRAELHLVGLHCAACVWLIERLPSVLPGVRTARVAWSGARTPGESRPARLLVEWDPERVQLSAIAAFLHRAGYDVHAIDAEAEAAERRERRRELVRIAVAGASAGNVMLVSAALYAGTLQDMDAGFIRFFEWAALVLALPALTWSAMPFYRAAWTGLRMGRLHIDLPIALGLIGGFVASVIATVSGDPLDHREVYFDSVSVLVFFLLIGRWVQRRGQQWALSRTDLLQRLLPPRARRASGEEVASTALRPGDVIVVLPGEGLPADARVRAGASSIDASSLTGESLPQTVEVGDTVLAGTRNLHGRLELVVEAVGDQTRIGSLAARIMQADRSRAPIQHAVDTISGYFVAAVLLLALVGGLAWSHEPERAFAVVVALLVVSCPCALGLATPVALAVARGRAAERGILFGSAAAIESLADLRSAVFDKTGTLTLGEPSVVEVVHAGIDERELASLLLAVEGDSGHPIGQALRRHAEAHAHDRVEAIELEDLPGHGRMGTLAGARVRVGSVAWIAGSTPLAPEFARVLDAALARGETAVMVEHEGRMVALLSLSDTPRPDAREALERLRGLGLRLAIRSGDHPRTVAALADRLGVEDRRGACSPEDKAEEIARGFGPRTAMIGDGVNDAPAMRAASVGVAVRGGAEVALRVADVHLARAGVNEVVALVEGSRRTMAVVRRNLAFSLVYNLLFASLALAGQIDPLTAALLMPASSLTVLLSSVWSRTFAANTETVTDARQSLHGVGPVRVARSP